MRHRTREWTDCLYNQLPSFLPPPDGKDRASQHLLILLFGADAACWQDLAQTLDWESGNKAALRFCSHPLLGVVAAATEVNYAELRGQEGGSQLTGVASVESIIYRFATSAKWLRPVGYASSAGAAKCSCCKCIVNQPHGHCSGNDLVAIACCDFVGDLQ